MTLPNSNISIMDVRNILGYPSTDLGTLSSCSNINQWSKYKPVGYDYSGAQDIRTYDPYWYRGSNGKCGINVPAQTSLSTIFTNFRNGTANYWNYLPPAGGSAQPYRLGDFRGYNTDSRPVMSMEAIADTCVVYGSMVIPVAVIVITPNQYELSLSDFTYYSTMNSMYFGAAIVSKNKTTYKYLTASSSIGDGSTGDNTVEIPASGFTTGEYEIVAFLSTGRKTDIDAVDVPNMFISLPNGYKIINIDRQAIRITISAQWNTNSTVNWTAQIYNKTNNNISLFNCRIIIGYGDFSIGDALEAGEYADVLGTIVATKQTTTTVSGTFTNALPNYTTRSGRIIFEQTTDPLWNVNTDFEDNE
jgi:hypothetical protein